MQRISLAVIAGLVVALSTGIAMAASGGSLTAFEYQQLVSTRDKLKTAKGLSAAISDCQQIQMQTELLDLERTDCVSQLDMQKFVGVMKSYVAHCTAYKSVAARLHCVLPPYRQLYAAESAFYRSESRIHRIATSRGLGEPCADLLSDRPAVISEEKVALEGVGKIISAAAAGNLFDFEADSGKAMTALAYVAKGQQANNAQPSICPHQ